MNRYLDYNNIAFTGKISRVWQSSAFVLCFFACRGFNILWL